MQGSSLTLLAQRCQYFTCLNLSASARLRQDFLNAAIPYFKSLRELTIREVGLSTTDATVAALEVRCQQADVQRLMVLDVSNITLVLSRQLHESFFFSSATLCGLTSLIISNHANIDDRCISSIAERTPLLQRFEFLICKLITALSLDSLVRHSGALSFLNIQLCSGIAEEAVSVFADAFKLKYNQSIDIISTDSVHMRTAQIFTSVTQQHYCRILSLQLLSS